MTNRYCIRTGNAPISRIPLQSLRYVRCIATLHQNIDRKYSR